MSLSAPPRAATDTPTRIARTRKSPDHAVRALRQWRRCELGSAAPATVAGGVCLAGVRLGGLRGRMSGLALGAGSGLLGLALFLRGQFSGIGHFLEGSLLSGLFGGLLGRNIETPAGVASVLA